MQGELPSHPELLDWLAVEFVAPAGTSRRLLRLMVTSATYRQSSQFTPELLARDPENRLLARGPRYRLPAELIRDQALAVGGLLVEQLGGPSVKPYQPAGALGGGLVQRRPDVSSRTTAAALYRRSLYTFWKRTVAAAVLLTFDGPTPRDLHRPAAADQHAAAGAGAAERRHLRRGRPRPGERDGPRGRSRPAEPRRPWLPPRDRPPAQPPMKPPSLEALYRRQLAAYRERPSRPRHCSHQGESPADPTLDPCELAAWTMTASVLLNLDETITQH